MFLTFINIGSKFLSLRYLDLEEYLLCIDFNIAIAIANFPIIKATISVKLVKIQYLQCLCKYNSKNNTNTGIISKSAVLQLLNTG